MKKGLYIAALCLFFMLPVGCTAEQTQQAQQEESSMELFFANRTGQDVAALQIRPDTQSGWVEIALTDGIWKSGYEIPVTLTGRLPDAPEGWQLRMIFADETEKIWQNVKSEGGDHIVFSLTESGEAEILTEE